jgi:hypothetical protein
MKQSSRSIISLVMTAVYLLVILAPLAPAALHSAPLTHLLTGECAGDCRSCGCSPERSAARACCCWQKKLAEAKILKPAAEHTSCPTSTAAVTPKPAGSCCSRSAEHTDHEDEAALSTQAASTNDTSMQTVSISTCPCGSGKDLTFAAGETIQHIPFRFSAGIPLQQVTRFAFLQPERLDSRSDQPPDPPPKILIVS